VFLNLAHEKSFVRLMGEYNRNGLRHDWPRDQMLLPAQVLYLFKYFEQFSSFFLLLGTKSIRQTIKSFQTRDQSQHHANQPVALARLSLTCLEMAHSRFDVDASIPQRSTNQASLLTALKVNILSLK
jgi:hypothetical protein